MSWKARGSFLESRSKEEAQQRFRETKRPNSTRASFFHNRPNNGLSTLKMFTVKINFYTTNGSVEIDKLSSLEMERKKLHSEMCTG